MTPETQRKVDVLCADRRATACARWLLDNYEPVIVVIALSLLAQDVEPKKAKHLRLPENVVRLDDFRSNDSPSNPAA